MKKIILLLLCICFVFCLFSCDNESVSDSSYQHVIAQNDTINGELSRAKSEFESLQSEFDDAKAEIVNLQSELTETKKVETISSLDDSINDKEAKLTKLQSEINELQNQIDLLNDEIVKIENNTLSFPAGYFYVGDDFAVGRYKIEGTTDTYIVIRDKRGCIQSYVDFSKVNEYIFTFSNENYLESDTPFKLTKLR